MYIDRTFGPLAGTVAGLGLWLSLVLKSAFALVGFGAYLEVLYPLPLTPLALALCGAVVVLNVMGVRKVGRVQTYVNEALLASLDGESDAHPAGVSAVKELYGSAGEDVRGWSVSIKFQSDSAGGAGWHWYERFDGNVFADSAGARGCTGCHSSNFSSFTSKDFLLSPFPLQ